MFEREIKFIYDFNLNKVKKTGSFLTYEQLLAADLHPAIMQYISAEIDYLIFEDRQTMLKSSVFDYSGGKITHYFNLISQEVKKSKRFSTEYISKLILHASSFTVNYLIRPKWSLLKFIFDDDERKSAVEIKQILNYLYYYGYLKNVLISYLDKKKILSMSKDEFAELLDKIEKLGIETYLDDVLNTALKSMAEFFNIGSKQKSKIPLPGIHIFLKEKKLADHINRLNNYFGADEKVNQEIQDVQKVLMSLQTKQNDLFEEIIEEEIEDTKTRLDEEIIEYPEEEIFSSEKTEPEPESVNDEIENEEETVHGEDTESENVETDIHDELPEIEEEIDEPVLEEESQNIELEDPEEEPEIENENAEDLIIEEEINEEIEEPVDESAESEIEPEEKYELGNKEEKVTIEDEQEEVIDESETPPLESVLEETDEPETEEESVIVTEDEPENDKTVSYDDEPETEEESEVVTVDVPENNETIIHDEVSETIEESQEPEIQDEQTEIEEVIEEELVEEEKFVIENKDDAESEEEPNLFGKEELESEEEVQAEEEFETQEQATENEEIGGAAFIDMSEILENKNMTKIIDNIFDYDMEEFANTIDLISECPSKAEALALINELFENNNVKSSSREAETFKSIISEYFDKTQ